MSARKALHAFVAALAVLGGVSVAVPEAGSTVEAGNSKAVWKIEVSLTRHGQRARYVIPANYSSRDAAIRGYNAWARSLESGANPSLERIYTVRY